MIILVERYCRTCMYECSLFICQKENLYVHSRNILNSFIIDSDLNLCLMIKAFAAMISEAINSLLCTVASMIIKLITDNTLDINIIQHDSFLQADFRCMINFVAKSVHQAKWSILFFVQLQAWWLTLKQLLLNAITHYSSSRKFRSSCSRSTTLTRRLQFSSFSFYCVLFTSESIKSYDKTLSFFKSDVDFNWKAAFFLSTLSLNFSFADSSAHLTWYIFLLFQSLQSDEKTTLHAYCLVNCTMLHLKIDDLAA